MFSKTVEYALQAIIFISNRSKDNPVSQKEITDSLNIPYHYLGKIIQKLTHAGIVSSKTGPNGGFYLRRQSNNITLCDIVFVFEGKECLEGCVLGFPGCDDETPCPVHSEWSSAKEIIMKFMTEHTVADWNKELKVKLDHIKQLKMNMSLNRKGN